MHDQLEASPKTAENVAGGFAVLPGSRVDVVLTLQKGQITGSRVLLENVLVIAIAPVGAGPSEPAMIDSASRAPNTMPSNSELEGNRLAPCTPVMATSPAANRRSMLVVPFASVTAPPQQ